MATKRTTRKCTSCKKRKPLSSYYSEDPKHTTCRGCILTRKPKTGIKAGSRMVDGKVISPERQVALRQQVGELGGKFAPTDVEGMLRFVEMHETPTNILLEAQDIVDGKRREDYGHPAENHARTAAMWSAYLGVPITPRQVCVLNILQKCSRDAHSATHDNLVDVAGWSRNAQLCTPEEYDRESED